MGLLDRIALGKQAKVVNQAMRRLEKKGMTGSPAYQSAQAYLTLLGVKQTDAGPRRFPESYVNKDDRTLRAFEKGISAYYNPSPGGFQTGTVQGYREYYNTVYGTADSRYHLQEHGVSKEEYLDFWEHITESEQGKMYGSKVYIKILNAYSTKYKDRGKYTVNEVVDRIQSSKTFLGALKSVGLSLRDYASMGGFE